MTVNHIFSTSRQDMTSQKCNLVHFKDDPGGTATRRHQIVPVKMSSHLFCFSRQQTSKSYRVNK